ncbi:helix-turn-helix transcriptional regulator [Ruminococcus sp.]|uniref:helix-turn-helix transcriptional regulator n=1 Tax=Ruminococcus sp. TaxID=41978 RepID=UPI0025CB9CE6|nr:helix-turn-helix transcriptional regulator [Ruminococcus sp.]MBR1430171.1 helix-turn-helix transcriptional regulator [Ruminococcus sp.]
MRTTTKKITPFGKIIKQYLLKEGMTQAAFARKSGIASPYLSQIIYGDLTPTTKTANKICAATGTPLNEAYNILFGESE